jgi:predicted RecA/RadA family phage recombinase
MKNHIQEGDRITVVSPIGGLASGQGVIIGALFGVSCYDAAAGSPAEIETVGVFSLPKAGAVAFAQGAVVYWDVSAGAVTSTASTNFPIGVATQAAAASDTTAAVRLDGVATVAAT